MSLRMIYSVNDWLLNYLLWNIMKIFLRSSKYLSRYFLSRKFLPFFSRPPTQDDVQELLNVISSIEKMYRQQFNVEKFYLLWIGEDKWIEFIKKHSKLKVLTLKYDKFDESHPNSKGSKQIADYLFSHQELFN